MRASRLLRLMICLCAAATAARADWNPADTSKWAQLPDLSSRGVDVMAAQPKMLADDFRCTESGAITGIHIWGSWKFDAELSPFFVLGIWSDRPADPAEPLSHSQPSNLLWSRVYAPGQYQQRVYATVPGGEWWYNPNTGELIPQADSNVWQYNFSVEPAQAFTQQEGCVYWLSVQTFFPEPAGPQFGWKTSATHWNDDAVWTDTPGQNWHELRYPLGHPLYPGSMDLAFVLTGQPIEPVQAKELCPKWIQPPDCEIGLDVQSWRTQEGPGPFAVADDWLCDGRPVTALRWWGSYLGWLANDPNPTAPPPPVGRPWGFWLTWYADVPAGVDAPYSHPGAILATNYYPLEQYGLTNPVPGVVNEHVCCVSDLGYIAPGLFEHEYLYTLVLPTNAVWNEKAGRVYWLGIEAVYGLPPATNAWGWKTCPPEQNWNDDAVVRPNIAPLWQELTYPPLVTPWGDLIPITNHPYRGESVNMAFELLTDVCPRRCEKWSQLPDMYQGTDKASWRWQDRPGPPLRADDFVSDGRPITDIHWWGSYIGWESKVDGSETNPVQPPPGLNLGFDLSWHGPNSTNETIPGDLIRNLFVPIQYCHETYYGPVTQEWAIGQSGIYEHEYQYYVDLLDPAVSGEPWFELAGTHYWLNVRAVLVPAFEPSPDLAGWGWKTSAVTQEMRSAVSFDDGLTWTHDAYGWPHPNSNGVFDLSFELTTTNIPPAGAVTVKFARVQATASPDVGRLWTTGYCGCGRQVLERSADLSQGSGGWAGVQTNAAPRPANVWRVSPAGPTNFYRIRVAP